MPSASDFKSFSRSGQTILVTKYHFQTLLLCTNKIYFPILTEFWRLYACGLKNVLKYLNDEGANEMPDFQPPLIWEEKNSSSPQHSINYFLKNRTTFWFQTSAYFLTSINLDDNYEKIVGNMTTNWKILFCYDFFVWSKVGWIAPESRNLF